MVRVSLAIYIGIWVIIVSITRVPVIISVNILIYITVVIIIITTVGMVLIIVIWDYTGSLGTHCCSGYYYCLGTEFWPLIPSSALPIVFLSLIHI